MHAPLPMASQWTREKICLMSSLRSHQNWDLVKSLSPKPCRTRTREKIIYYISFDKHLCMKSLGNSFNKHFLCAFSMPCTLASIRQFNYSFDAEKSSKQPHSRQEKSQRAVSEEVAWLLWVPRNLWHSLFEGAGSEASSESKKPWGCSFPGTGRSAQTQMD